MEIDSPLAWLVLAVSIASFTVVSLAETSLVSLRLDRVQGLVAKGLSGSKALESLQSVPMGPAGSFSILKFVFFASSLVFSAAIVIVWSDARWGLVSLVSLAMLVLLGLIHIAVRALARLYGEWVALRVAFLALGLARVFTPLMTIGVERSSRAAPNGIDASRESVAGELSISVDPNGEPLDEREVRMIRGVFQLDKTTAREIMVPRVDTVAAELGTTLDELAEQMVESGHSRVPIYEGSLDQIKGIAYARDILDRLSSNDESSRTLKPSLIRPALFIPESKTLEELLKEFQERQVNIAIVIDEYGGVSGLVTIEDLLEEIVGEIKDEFEVGEPEIEPLGENEFVIDARVGIDQLDELLDVTVEGDGFDTVGGFVYQRLGKIPSPGDTVEYDSLKIEVVSTVGRRLKRLRVTRSSEVAEPE